jgi:hypothetical protein
MADNAGEEQEGTRQMSDSEVRKACQRILVAVRVYTATHGEKLKLQGRSNYVQWRKTMRNIVKRHVDPYGVNLWRYFDTDNFWDVNQHQKMLIEMGVAGVRPVIHPTTGASTVANITTESQRYFRIVNTILIRQLLSDFLS